MSKEDIEILEELLKAAKFNNMYEENKYFKSIENMLNESKANKKRIEELEIVILKDYISKFIIKETLNNFRDKLTWCYNDWKYDEKVYLAEHNILNKIEEELLKDGGE